MSEFDYVNEYYPVKLRRGTKVVHVRSGREGKVYRADGQYIYIMWDGDEKSTGPYHPTDGLEYPEAE